MIARFFDPAVLLSLAVLLYGGAFYLWFVVRKSERGVLVLWAACVVLHLTLHRYHSLMNSPSLQLLLALFWAVPALVYANAVRQRAGHSDAYSYTSAGRLAVVTGITLVYVVFSGVLFFSDVAPELLFVLQPGLLFTAVYLIDGRRDDALIFAAFGFFFAVLWYLSYAPLAVERTSYTEPAEMWPVPRNYLGLLWAVAPLAILRDELDRPRILVMLAAVFFSGLMQHQMGTLPGYLGFLTVIGAALIGGRYIQRRVS